MTGRKGTIQLRQFSWQGPRSANFSSKRQNLIKIKFHSYYIVGFFLQFGRGDSHFGSTHRVDFKNYGKFLPDVTTRRKALQQHNVS